MTEQRYNYLDRSIQEMSGFIETMVENLETPSPQQVIRSLTRKKKKKNSKKGKAIFFEDSDDDSSDDKKFLNKKNEFTTLKALL